MHSRFEGARVLIVRAPGGEFRVHLVEGCGLRFLGLMRVPADEVEPLLFPRCRSVHMYWMRTAIDVVWLDLELDGEEGTGRVLGVEAELARRKTASAPAGLDPEVRERVAALELRPGDAARLGIAEGSSVVWRKRPSRR